jgi:Type I restriction modification DNA specificity domain
MRIRRNVVSSIYSLGDLADVQMGYPFRSRLENDPNGDVAVVQMKDIDDANRLHTESALKVSLPTGKARHLLRAGDLLFRSRGRSYGAAQVLEGIGAAVLSAPMLMIRTRGVLPSYLCWYLNLPSTQAALAALAVGTSVQMVSKESLVSLPVPIPDLERQRQVVDIFALARRVHTLATEIATKEMRLNEQKLLRYAKNSR